MAIEQIGSTLAETVVAATHEAGTAPDAETDGFKAGSDGGRIRTFVTYAGSVTACALRLYTRAPGTDAWFRGASTDDGAPLDPESGDESRDWDVGEGVEFAFVVESVSPGTEGNTVAVTAVGVNR